MKNQNKSPDTASPGDTTVIDLLIHHELQISTVYRLFASRLPQTRTFWEQMAIEEQAHADVLRQLAARVRSGQVLLRLDRFSSVAVTSSIDYLTKRMETLSAGLTNVQALSLALDLEHSAIEKHFFEVFGSELPSMRAEFAALQQHTAKHASQLAELLDTERKRLQDRNA